MRERLINGAEKMGIEMSPRQADMFMEYHKMLTAANAEMNLTRVPDDPAEAVDRNYLDSIAPLMGALPKNTATLADVGSGAGFPGIPLSIMLPDTHITLIDSLGKRVGFLKSVIDALDLNAEAVHARAEEAGRQSALRDSFDVVVSRAVASLNVLAELCLPLVKEGGIMLAYKGPQWREELDGAKNALEKLCAVHEAALPAPVPERDWNHTIIVIRKTAPTPDRFPRRPGMPEKRPL